MVLGHFYGGLQSELVGVGEAGGGGVLDKTSLTVEWSMVVFLCPTNRC